MAMIRGRTDIAIVRQRPGRSVPSRPRYDRGFAPHRKPTMPAAASPSSPTDGPLAGLSVVELHAIGPVPFAGQVLRSLGATVTRISPPTDPGLGVGIKPEYDLLNLGKERRPPRPEEARRPRPADGAPRDGRRDARGLPARRARPARARAEDAARALPAARHRPHARLRRRRPLCDARRARHQLPGARRRAARDRREGRPGARR